MEQKEKEGNKEKVEISSDEVAVGEALKTSTKVRVGKVNKRGRRGSGNGKVRNPERVIVNDTPSFSTIRYPSFTDENAGAQDSTTLTNQDYDSEMRLITRLTVDYIKFSPLGDNDSIARVQILRILKEWKQVLAVNNVEYTYKGALPTISVEEIDEYIEMCMNYIIVGEILSMLFTTSREKKADYPQGLQQYCGNCLEGFTKVPGLLAKHNVLVKKIAIPPNILLLIRDLLGMYNCELTNSTPSVKIYGIQIPTNYDSYKIQPKANSLYRLDIDKSVYESSIVKKLSDKAELKDKKKSEIEEGVTLEDYKSDEVIALNDGYNKDNVVNLPPVIQRDKVAMKAILNNFILWSEQAGGTYDKISQILNLVCPHWRMRDYTNDFVGFKSMDNFKYDYFRNLGILDNDKLKELATTNNANRTDRLVYFRNSNCPQTNVRNMAISYRTIIVGSGDEQKIVPYPGLIHRLPILDEKYVYDGNPTFLLTKEGLLKRIDTLRDVDIIGNRFFTNGVNGNLELLKINDDVTRVNVESLESYFDEYFRWYLSNEDFVSSPLFRSQSL